jgi:hemolysin activation/secretion protein
VGVTTRRGLRLCAAASVLLLLGPLPRAGAATPPDQQPAPAPASARHFDLDEIRVEGNTVLSVREIETAVYPFLGPDKTAEDVEKARAALEQLYSSKGYATVSAEIPEQRVSEGVAVIKLTERPVGRLRVTGARYFVPDAVRAGAPSLAEGTVPNLKHVQNNIVALNQWPDRTVTPSLRAGRAPDTVDVDLQVQDNLPLHGSLELNNRKSQDTTPLRVAGSLSYGNLWQRGDSASFSFQVAPQQPSDAEVFSGSYLFRIPNSNLSLLGSYLRSNSNVSTVGASNVVGKGTIAGLRLLIPLGLEEGFIHSLNVGFDYKDLTQAVGVGGTFSNAPVQYVPLTASHQASWNSEHAQTDLLASLVFGTQGLGSNAAEFDQQRFAAQPNFSYLRADLTRTQTLPADIEAWGHVTGQISGDPLLSSEQLSLGGLDSVRGYLESEVLGDYGIAVQTELRSPSVAPLIGAPLTALRFHAFFDAGTANIHDPLPEQASSYSLSSVGVGTRVTLANHFHGSLEDAVALTNGPVTKSGSNRVLFRLYGDF